MKFIDRYAVALLLVFSLFSSYTSSEAASIRLFVKKEKGLFEIKGATGGRLVVSPTGENIQVPQSGRYPVLGYTDRFTSGENYIVLADGRGPALLTIFDIDSASGKTINIRGPLSVNLPIVLSPIQLRPLGGQQVSLKSGTQNLFRNVPVGTRP